MVVAFPAAGADPDLEASIVAAIRGGRDGARARDPESAIGLLRQIEGRFAGDTFDEQAPPRAMRTCTAALAGLASLAREQIGLIAGQLPATPFSRLRPDAQRAWLCGPDHEMKTPLWRLALLARYATLARRVRTERRRAVARLLEELDRGVLTCAEVVQDGLLPLLCLAQAPLLVYGAALGPDWAALWNPARTAAIDTIATPPGGGMDRLRAVVAGLLEYPDAGVRDAARYLATALMVHDHGIAGATLQAPLLQASPGGWPAALIVEALVIPDLPEAWFDGSRGTLAAESFTPARRAAQAFFRGELADADLNAIGTTVVLGDYPGGGVPVGRVDGPSAGGTLAAALLARFASLDRRDDALITAAVELHADPAGAPRQPVLKALGPHGHLLQKGLGAALAGYRTLVVADGDDVDQARLGTELVPPQDGEESCRVLPLHALSALVGPVLEDIYAPLMDEYVRLGDDALKRLEELAARGDDAVEAGTAAADAR